MKISKKALAIEPSLSRQLFNMAKAYDDVIDLTLGDPDIPPHKIIKAAACEATMQGRLRYSANAGLPALRERIAKTYRNEYGLPVDSNKNIIVTVGGMEALFLSLACMIDDGDEVVILAPYYVNYKQMVTMCGGKPVIINTAMNNGFIPQRAQIEAAITDRTVAIIINTPSNPTGAVFGLNDLEMIAQIAEKYDISVISDEVYKTLVYDDTVYRSIATLPNMQQRTIVVDSLSKRFAMTGYRLGYAIGPESFITSMVKMQENVAACAPVASQYAGIAAFDHCVNDFSIQEEFRKRRDFVYGQVNSIEGLACNKPQATFYMFVNIEKAGMDGLAFAYKLLEEEHVAVVPGMTYGNAYTGYIRIAYTLEIDKLRIAMDRIRAFMQKIIK